MEISRHSLRNLFAWFSVKFFSFYNYLCCFIMMWHHAGIVLSLFYLSSNFLLLLLSLLWALEGNFVFIACNWRDAIKVTKKYKNLQIAEILFIYFTNFCYSLPLAVHKGSRNCFMTQFWGRSFSPLYVLFLLLLFSSQSHLGKNRKSI